jgi:hypothetical protein
MLAGRTPDEAYRATGTEKLAARRQPEPSLSKPPNCPKTRDHLSRQVFGAVTRAETDITSLIQRTLKTVGRTDTTEVTAFTDGGADLRTVPTNAGVTKPPILDWFHIAMRLQHTNLAAANLSTGDPAG